MVKDNTGTAPGDSAAAGAEFHGMCTLPLHAEIPSGTPTISLWPHDIVGIQGVSPGECWVLVSRSNFNKHYVVPLSADVVRLRVWDALTRFAAAGFAAELSRKGVADVVKGSAAICADRMQRELPAIINDMLQPAVEKVLAKMTGERIDERDTKKKKVGAVSA